MNIADRSIGPSEPVYLIADPGGNHNGSLSTALRLIEVAAECGADAIKFQFFRADTMVAPDHPDYDTFKQYEIPNFWLKPMKDHAADCGIHLFYSVFAAEDVAALEELADPPAYKVASAELTYTDLLEAVAATGKPVILSTGMSEWEQVKLALAFCPDAEILHCVSAYPTPPEEINLRRVQNPGAQYIGLSDHTADPYAAPLMAAALGASVMEKHFRLEGSTGPDAPFSIFPDDLKRLATSLHQAHLMLGDGVKRVMPSEQAALADRRVLINGKWLRGYPA